jgi:hypothetical protein
VDRARRALPGPSLWHLHPAIDGSVCWRALLLGSPVLGKSSLAHRRPAARVLAALQCRAIGLNGRAIIPLRPSARRVGTPPPEYDEDAGRERGLDARCRCQYSGDAAEQRRLAAGGVRFFYYLYICNKKLEHIPLSAIPEGGQAARIGSSLQQASSSAFNAPPGMAVTSALPPRQNRAHASASCRRLAKRSPRRYAASTLSPT